MGWSKPSPPVPFSMPCPGDTALRSMLSLMKSPWKTHGSSSNLVTEKLRPVCGQQVRAVHSESFHGCFPGKGCLSVGGMRPQRGAAWLGSWQRSIHVPITQLPFLAWYCLPRRFANSRVCYDFVYKRREDGCGNLRLFQDSMFRDFKGHSTTMTMNLDFLWPLPH